MSKRIFVGKDSLGHEWHIVPREPRIFSSEALCRAYRSGGQGCYIGDYFLVVRDYEIVVYGDRDEYLADLWEDGGVTVATLTETA